MKQLHLLKTIEDRQGIKISAPEEIRLFKRWINKEELKICEKYGKSTYGEHLRHVALGKIKYRRKTMKIIETELKDLLVIEPKFMVIKRLVFESYSYDKLKLNINFIQDNHSLVQKRC